MFRHFPRLSINSVVIIGGTTKKFVSVLVYSRAAPAQRALTSLGTGFLGLSGRGGRGEIGIWGPRFCWAVFFTVSTDDKLMLKTCFNWLVFYVFFMLKNWLIKNVTCHLFILNTPDSKDGLAELTYTVNAVDPNRSPKLYVHIRSTILLKRTSLL